MLGKRLVRNDFEIGRVRCRGGKIWRGASDPLAVAKALSILGSDCYKAGKYFLLEPEDASNEKKNWNAMVCFAEYSGAAHEHGLRFDEESF